jgi:hypothetical protein
VVVDVVFVNDVVDRTPKILCFQRNGSKFNLRVFLFLSFSVIAVPLDAGEHTIASSPSQFQSTGLCFLFPMPLFRAPVATSANGMPNVRRRGRGRISARARVDERLDAVAATDESRGVGGDSNTKDAVLASKGSDGGNKERLPATAALPATTALPHSLQRPPVRQALALDTRLVIRGGEKESSLVVDARAQMYATLIKGLLHTGAVPKTVVFTGPGEAPDSLSIESQGDLHARHLESLTIRPTVFHLGAEETSTPKPLQPKKGWKIFGSMSKCRQEVRAKNRGSP